MSKEKLIPELRFPEFENDGEWELKNVEEFFNVGSSKRVLQKDWTNEGVPFYRTRELVSLSKNEPFGSEIYISEELYEELKTQYGMPTEGDFLVSGVGTLGISYQVKTDDKFYFKDGNVLWFKLVGDLVSSYFKYCFESEHIQKQIVGQTSKSTVGTYTITNAKKTEFWYTDNPQEQQKIASCLSSLDELIAAHKDKLDALKDHKKGLLQNLFPQEGETVPKVRFPEFEGDGEWVERKLGEISHKIMVGIASAATQAYRKSGIILFRNQNIKEGYLDDRDILYIDEEYEKAHKNKRLKAGDLLTARTGYPGTTCVVPKKYEGSQSFTTLITRPDNSIVNSKFLCLFINSEKGQSFFEATKIGGGQKNVNAGSLAEMPILFPSKKEQQKIASCLSAVDELITAQQDKIEQLQQHKKGLMQGLFPKMTD